MITLTIHTAYIKNIRNPKSLPSSVVSSSAVVRRRGEEVVFVCVLQLVRPAEIELLEKRQMRALIVPLRFGVSLLSARLGSCLLV